MDTGIDGNLAKAVWIVATVATVAVAGRKLLVKYIN
jgi:hypothetical protein